MHFIQDLLVEDVTVYSSPCMSLVVSLISNISIRRFNVLKKGARYGSSNVDCIHSTGARGQFIFEDSVLEGSGDDGLNINNQNSHIEGIYNSTTFYVSSGSTTNNSIGIKFSTIHK